MGNLLKVLSCPHIAPFQVAGASYKESKYTESQKFASSSSAHRIIISGTPLQNNLKELWALFNFCCPELLGDKKWFKEKYEYAILRGNEKKATDREKRIGSAVAKAYASYMKGNLLFEQDQNWDTALMNFKSARAVYEELGKYGDLENQVLCREHVKELEPSIRYCLHKIGESNLQASELLQIGEMEGPALDLFKAKLEAVMAEARSQQAASMTEFHWLGHRFPIANAKTRVAIVKAQELEKDLHGPAADSLPAEKRLAIFDKIFTAYHEARSCIRSDLVLLLGKILQLGWKEGRSLCIILPCSVSC
ncbi:hypothetical protein ACJW31_02G130600 [Castanea mollissima]